MLVGVVDELGTPVGAGTQAAVDPIEMDVVVVPAPGPRVPRVAVTHVAADAAADVEVRVDEVRPLHRLLVLDQHVDELERVLVLEGILRIEEDVDRETRRVACRRMLVRERVAAQAREDAECAVERGDGRAFFELRHGGPPFGRRANI